MVCLFPMSECANTKPQFHRCSNMKCFFKMCGYVRYEILGQKEARAKEEIRCLAATGPFGPHYNGSISSFSPLWIAAPLTVNKGCRPASCQVVSTPFSATLWPTPRPLLRLHSLEKGFCSGQKDFLMGDNFCFKLRTQLLAIYLIIDYIFPFSFRYLSDLKLNFQKICTNFEHALRHWNQTLPFTLLL